MIRRIRGLAVSALVLETPAPLVADVTSVCIDGAFNLGARYQGLEPAPGEWTPSTWCVAVDALPASSVVLNSHSGVRTPVSRLEDYLGSSRCQPEAARH